MEISIPFALATRLKSKEPASSTQTEFEVRSGFVIWADLPEVDID
jgi:hypothetical protein